VQRLSFVKYQGTGNDFILVDGRKGLDAHWYQESVIAQLCDRRFGIGADGYMVLESSSEADFHMHYCNSDGKPSSMCGNGGRCIAHWAHSLGLGRRLVCAAHAEHGSEGHLRFTAPDGLHEAWVSSEGSVRLAMHSVRAEQASVPNEATAILDTGSPHYVSFREEPDDSDWDLTSFAHSIRYNETYAKVGINVNAVWILEDGSLKVRTYERGVEDETYSCGTGVTACALAYALKEQRKLGSYSQVLHTPGGLLKVHYHWDGWQFDRILLEGPAELVFSGTV
jgi:diaminopimelate epimerase